jgi:formyl-CoA transferase
VTNRVALVEIIGPIIRRESRDAWVSRLGIAGVPCGSIRTVGEVCEANQLVSRGMILGLKHPKAPDLRSIASPFRFDDQVPMALRPPPLLDQHRGEILHDWLRQSRVYDSST